MRKLPAIRMDAEFKHIKPAALSRQALAWTAELETLAPAKNPAPVRRINTAGNPGPAKDFR